LTSGGISQPLTPGARDGCRAFSFPSRLDAAPDARGTGSSLGFTNEPIGPFELSEVVIASLVIRKLLLELEECEALVFFLHNFDR
ncbi:MAG: hypothetical protein AAF600_21515, partial [Bacteroidota bacterium]